MKPINPPGKSWPRLRRQGLRQEPTPKAVRLIPFSNTLIPTSEEIYLQYTNYFQQYATLDGDAVDTLIAIPCHVMQGNMSSRTNAAGFRFNIAADSLSSRKSNPTSPMSKEEVGEVF